LDLDAVWDCEWGRSRDGCIRRVHMPQGEGAVSWGFSPIGFNGVFVEQKCIQLMREKLTFP